tara:strand:- start:2728 stop:3579 length:852 start_codon:yes stop_codon:yes gene_type:complete
MQTKIRKEITDKILKALKAGVAPWVRPWTATGSPTNRKTSTGYKGINVWILNLASLEQGWGSQWLTFKQAKALGGSVRKGEKSTRIIFWNVIDKKDDAGKLTGDTFMFMKLYSVFNVDQCEGLPAVEAEEVPEFERHARAEEIIDATGAEIHYGGDRACYHRDLDRISIPVREDFTTPAGFYATVLHELVHWTGASARLDREKGEVFGDKLYAKEELVAEMGSAFLCAEARIDGELQHESYIGSWIKALESDERFIFDASSKAQKASDYILKPSAKESKKKVA